MILKMILVTLGTIVGLVCVAALLLGLAWRIIKSMYSTTGED